MKNLKPIIKLYQGMTIQGKVITWFAAVMAAIIILDFLFDV